MYDPDDDKEVSFSAIAIWLLISLVLWITLITTAIYTVLLKTR